MPRFGMSISSIELGVILLSAVQKVGYDRATNDQKKAVQAFVLGKDVFLQRATVHTRPWVFSNRTKKPRIPWLATRRWWVNNSSRQ